MIRVLGLGNVLLSDDGFGPFVVRVLEAAYDCPKDVEIVDAGTPGLDLTPFLLGTDAVVFVDTVSSHGTPGEIRVYDRDAILRVPLQARTGGHDPALKDALLIVAAAGGGPSTVTLVGAIPAWIATGVTLSPALEAAVGPAVQAIVTALAALGVRLVRKAHPGAPHLWWAESPAAHCGLVRTPGAGWRAELL
jgi:hydrogenase maturation protease